jgi:hypothetical protein
MTNDLLLSSDGGYTRMTAITEAGRAFIKANSMPPRDGPERTTISLGATANLVVKAAKAAGLSVETAP